MAMILRPNPGEFKEVMDYQSRWQEDRAMQLVRTRYRGYVPEYVTLADCLLLMRQLADLEGQEAERLRQLYLESLEQRVPFMPYYDPKRVKP